MYPVFLSYNLLYLWRLSMESLKTVFRTGPLMRSAEEVALNSRLVRITHSQLLCSLLRLEKKVEAVFLAYHLASYLLFSIVPFSFLVQEEEDWLAYHLNTILCHVSSETSDSRRSWTSPTSIVINAESCLLK